MYVVMVAPEYAPAANFFGRDRLYGYWDDPERFAFFSKAAIEFMLRANKRPDIIHLSRLADGARAGPAL